MLNTVVRQIVFYTFEREVHTRRKQGERTTADLNLTYTPPWLRQVTFALAALNLFDEDPPRVRGVVPGFFFDSGNANPLGRFVSLEARVRW